jgi:hypothetical protein
MITRKQNAVNRLLFKIFHEMILFYREKPWHYYGGTLGMLSIENHVNLLFYMKIYNNRVKEILKATGHDHRKPCGFTTGSD